MMEFNDNDIVLINNVDDLTGPLVFVKNDRCIIIYFLFLLEDSVPLLFLDMR